jgi:outer membrane autotransporter protein
VFGSHASVDGDGNAAGYRRSIGGFFAGLDTGDPGAWRFGIAGGYKNAAVSIADRNSTASIGTSEIAAYGAVQSGRVALRFGGAYASGDADTVRGVTFPGFDETLRAHYGVHVGQVFGEVAYRADVGRVKVEPFANIAYVGAHTDGFTETGGSAALSGAAENHSMTVGSVGARFSGDLPRIGAHMSALIAWQHRWGDMTPAADVAFSAGTSFRVAGPSRKRDSVRVEAGLDWDIGKRSKFSLAYTGQIGSGGSDHGLTARFSIRF